MGIGLVAGVGGLASAGASLIGASESADAAQAAADAQVKSAQIASDTQRDFFNQSKNALQPFMNLGGQAAGQLGSQLTDLTKPVAFPTMTQADLEATPGYEFTKTQGLKAVQNSAAARGLGISGAALKGAASYATGLSDATYDKRFDQAQTQWQDQVANNSNSFNKLYQATGVGADAAGNLAGGAIKTGAGIAQTQTNAGNAQAAGINAAGQATAAGYTGASSAFNNALQQYMAPKSMYGGSGGAAADSYAASALNPTNYNANGFQGWYGV